MNMSFSKLKKIILRTLIAILSLSVVLRLGYRLYTGKEVKKEIRRDPIVELQESQLIKQIEPLFEQPASLSYNFNRMLQLIDAATKIKKEFDWSFGSGFFFIRKKKKVDLEFVQRLVDELMRERERLLRYIRDLKGRRQSGIPVKRYRSLLYYLEVLENLTVEMRDILVREQK